MKRLIATSAGMGLLICSGCLPLAAATIIGIELHGLHKQSEIPRYDIGDYSEEARRARAEKVAEEEKKARKIRSDIDTIETALDSYKKDSGSYPSTIEGLKALIIAPTTMQTQKGRWKGPYLKNIPKDTLGGDYNYEFIDVPITIVDVPGDNFDPKKFPQIECSGQSPRWSGKIKGYRLKFKDSDGKTEIAMPTKQFGSLPKNAFFGTSVPAGY